MGGSSGGRGSSVCRRPSSEDRLRDSTRGGADGFLCWGTLTGGSAAGVAPSPSGSGFPTPLAMAEELGGAAAGSWTASELPLALCCESPLTRPSAGISSLHRGGKEVEGVAEEGELAGELATLPRRPDTAWGFLDASCSRSNMARAL